METIKREFDVERHAVTSVVIFEVMGEDLEHLEKETLTVGEDFSFALASFSIALSFTVTLSTVVIPDGKRYDVFWIIMLLGYISGLFFGVRWFRGRKQFKGIITKIRNRGGQLGEKGKPRVEAIASVVTTTVAVEKTTKGG